MWQANSLPATDILLFSFVGLRRVLTNAAKCKRPRAKDDADVWLHTHLYMLQAAKTGQRGHWGQRADSI
jgi:hypothetical protein